MRWPLAPSELRELTPGAMSSTSLNARRALIGAARNKSPSTVIVLVGRPVDTIGDSPDTVTVSDSVPTFKSMSTVNVLPARIRIPSRRHAANPESSAARLTVPGGRFCRR